MFKPYTPIKRKFVKLKARMFEMGVRQADLEPVIRRGIAYINNRFNGKESWTVEEMKEIGTLLEIPRDQWLDYFLEESA